MQNTDYTVTEFFRSTTLSQRKRNLQRLMENYLLEALERQDPAEDGASPAPTP